MAYHKFTSISGCTKDGAHKCLTPVGHWKIDRAIKSARAGGVFVPP